MDRVQHRAAKFVLNRPWQRNVRDSISEMLESLKWPTPKQRRKCARLILLYKIVHNFVKIPAEYLPVLSPQP